MLLGQELKFKNKLCNFKRVPFSVTSLGNTLGIMAVNKTPCKGKSLLFRGKMKFFEKKVKKDAEKFGGMKKKHYLCTRF